MSQGSKCICEGKIEERMKNWEVIQYRGNHSAFNGYKWTRSDYSSLRCNKCRANWRTKASYVGEVFRNRPKE